MRELELVVFNRHIPRGANVLRGLPAISFFLTSDPSKQAAVETMINCHQLPVIRIGEKIVARKSSLSRWVSQQMAANEKRGKRRRPD